MFFAVQFAVYLGAEVYAVDMRPSSRELAKKFGAKQAFDLVELDAALAKGFKVDVAVDFVSTDTSEWRLGYLWACVLIGLFFQAFTREVKSVQNAELDSQFTRGGRVVIVSAFSSRFSAGVV